jgi:glycine hydroxymethyltransferase
MNDLSRLDTETDCIIREERRRLRETIDLIASENYASRAVMEAEGSILTNKYAEGYPGKRYYGGCTNMDTAESLARSRAKQLFGADHANVQPHSGAQANMAAYFALIEPGDTVLGMSLAHGGHLTHGAPASFSGKLYNFIGYGVDRETERIDYAAMERLADEHHPKLIVVGASAYPRVIDFERCRQIADRVGARLLADIAHIAGLVAVGLHPTPVTYADIITSTTHKTLRGPRSGFILCNADLAKAVDSAVFPEMQGGPLMHTVAAKAVAFHLAMQPEFADYQRATLENARVLAAELRGHGLRLVSGGTDNHLMLVDLTETGITGKAAQEALERSSIVSNRNAIPFDTKPAWQTSGIRLGTPAVTTRGFGVEEMKQVAGLIVGVIQRPGDTAVEQATAEEVADLCRRVPVPGIDED